MQKHLPLLLIGCLLMGFIGGAAGSVVFTTKAEYTKQESIANWYASEVAVLVSPHGLRKAMDKGDDSFILVDLRSQEEYEQEHIKGAINIPVYKNKENSEQESIDRVISSFTALPDYKKVIVYCYSSACMTGRKTGHLLAQNNIFVQELGIGWNEWRYDWQAWNYPHEWEATDVQDYIESGPDPGVPLQNNKSKACPIDNSLGC